VLQQSELHRNERLLRRDLGRRWFQLQAHLWGSGHPTLRHQRRVPAANDLPAWPWRRKDLPSHLPLRGNPGRTEHLLTATGPPQAGRFGRPCLVRDPW
jgi:hypothetical protein